MANWKFATVARTQLATEQTRTRHVSCVMVHGHHTLNLTYNRELTPVGKGVCTRSLCDRAQLAEQILRY